MKQFKSIILLSLGITLTASAGISAPGISENTLEIMKQMHLNYYYAQDDGKARVVMTLVDKNGNKKIKKFSMVRKDLQDGGDQLYFIYFRSPSDIKRMTFMVKKYNDRADERALYVPAIDLIKKIAASDKSSSFVGSDFSYEDVSGRLWTEDNHELLGETDLNGQAAYQIKSVPKVSDYFAYKMTYVSKKTILPLREEYYDENGTVFKVFTAEKIDTIQGVPTITVRKMENVAKKQYTTVVFAEIQYNIGIKKKYFSERYLRKPHMSLK